MVTELYQKCLGETSKELAMVDTTDTAARNPLQLQAMSMRVPADNGTRGTNDVYEVEKITGMCLVRVSHPIEDQMIS